MLDTSVIIEYIDRRGEYHEQAKVVFDAILLGKLKAIIPHPILSETYYVATRVYETLRLEQAGERAIKLVEWLYRLPTVIVKDADLSLAIEAGKVKLKYGIALTDCYVLASAKIYKGKAVFRKREREMQSKLSNIEKEYPIIFLEDYT